MTFNKKRIISWILIFAIIFTGINWPTFSSLADSVLLTEKYDIEEFEADMGNPYIAIILTKKDDLTHIYAVRSSNRIYYMSDYGILASNTGLETPPSASYYEWQDGLGWTGLLNYSTVYNPSLDRYVMFYNHEFNEGDSYNEGYETTFTIIEQDTLKDLKNSDLTSGNYIIGYGSLNENKILTNANLLEYKNLESVWSSSDENLYLLASQFINKQLYGNLKNTKNGTLESVDFNYKKVGLGDSISGFEAGNSQTFKDVFSGSGLNVMLNLNYKINDVQVNRKVFDYDDLVTVETYNNMSLDDAKNYAKVQIYVKNQNSSFITEDVYQGLSSTDKAKYVAETRYVQTNYLSTSEYNKLSDKEGYEYGKAYANKDSKDVPTDGYDPVYEYRKTLYMNSATYDAASDVDRYGYAPSTQTLYLYENTYITEEKFNLLPEDERAKCQLIDSEEYYYKETRFDSSSFAEYVKEQLKKEDVTPSEIENYAKVNGFKEVRVKNDAEDTTVLEYLKLEIITPEDYKNLNSSEQTNWSIHEPVVVYSKEEILSEEAYNRLGALVQGEYTRTIKEYVKYLYSSIKDDLYNEEVNVYKKHNMDNIIDYSSYEALNEQTKRTYEPITCYVLSSINLHSALSPNDFNDLTDETEKSKYTAAIAYAKITSTESATISDEESINKYAEFVGSSLNIAKSEIDGGSIPVGDENFTIDINITTSYNEENGVNFDYKMYVNGSSDISSINNELNHYLVSSIGKVSEIGVNTITSNLVAYGINSKSSSFNNKENSKEVNRFKIYNLYNNNVFSRVNEFDSTSKLKNIEYTISSIYGVDVNTINTKSYIDIYFDDEDNSWYMEIDADKIAEYRRDNRNADAFKEVVIDVIYGESHCSIKLELDVMQYLDGHFVEEDYSYNLSPVSFASALSDSYPPIVSELKFLNFDKSTKFLIDYSDYQLLFYSTDIPMLGIDGEGKEYLTFSKSLVDFEIYKYGENSWNFFNYLSNVRDAKIYLPDDYGHNAIQFINQDLVRESNITEVVLSANTIDSNYNIQFKLQQLPAYYYDENGLHSGNNDSIFSLNNYYYVMKKGQSTYYLISTDIAIDFIEGIMKFSDNTRVFVLTGNYWVELKSIINSMNDDTQDITTSFAEYASSSSKYYFDTNQTKFREHLYYTNDTNMSEFSYGDCSNNIGPRDFYVKVPMFANSEGQEFFVVQNKEHGFRVYQYNENAQMIIVNGQIKFNDLTKLTVKTYDEFNWVDGGDVTIDNGYITEVDGIAGSIIYTSKDILGQSKDGTNEVVLISKGTSMATINAEVQKTTFDMKKPSIANTSGLTSEIINNISSDGVSIDCFIYTYDGKVLVFDKEVNGNIFLDGALKGTSTGEKDIYISNWDLTDETSDKFEVNVYTLKPDEVNKTWIYEKSNKYEDSKVDNCVYVVKWKDIRWTSVDIPASDPTFADWDTLSDSTETFADELAYSGLISYTDEETGKTYQYVNPGSVVGDSDAYLMLDDNSNYWIFSTSKLDNIYNPVNNRSSATLAQNSSTFKLFVPVFEKAANIMSGSFSYDKNNIPVTSYTNGKTNLSISNGTFYTGIFTNDTKNPIIGAVYDLNGNINVYAFDENEYQQMSYDNGNDIQIKFVDGKVYQRVMTLADFNNLPENERIAESPTGPWYKLISENENGDYEERDGYLYYLGEKVIRTVLEDGVTVSYGASGVNSIYAKTKSPNMKFNGNVKVLVNEKTGETRTYSVGEAIPSESIIVFEGKYLPPLKDTSNSILEIYCIDNKGNKSNVVNLAPPTIGKKNEVLWGTATQEILDEIENAKQQVELDDAAPVILAAYIYKGKLYLLIEDYGPNGGVASGFNTSSWFTNFQYESFTNLNDKLVQDIVFVDKKGQTCTISSSENHVLNEFLKGNSKSWQGIQGEALQITLNTTHLDLIKDVKGKIQEGVIKAYCVDAKGNNSEVISLPVNEDSNNTIIYGPENVDERTIEMLNKAKNGEDPSESLNGYPVIQSIYVLNGILYVEATDDTGIDDYGFQWRYKSQMIEQVTGAVVHPDAVSDFNRAKQNAYENPTTYNEGDVIPAKTTIYTLTNYMPIKVPNTMTIYVTDIDNQVSTMNVNPTSANQVLYGNPSEAIQNQIRENGGETDTPDLNTFPVITAVYTYQGYLYVEGTADDGLATYAYSFSPDEDSTYPSAFEGYDFLGREISITSGKIINSGTKIYKEDNFQRISIPTLITVGIKDINGDETTQSLVIDKDNTIYFGSIDDIKNKEAKENISENTKPSNPDKPNENTARQEEENTPGIINPPNEEWADVDWSAYDYVLELHDINTDRLVYKIRKDEAVTIEMPKLQDSTTYKYKQILVHEETNAYSDEIVGTYTTYDSIPPVISKIWFSNHRLYVTAYDKGGLAKDAYKFVINGARVTNDKYIEENNIRAVYGDDVSITVRDACGNEQTVTIVIKNTTDNVLYQCVNPTSPIYVNTGTSKTISYWLAYLASNYKVDTSGLSIDKANCSNISFVENSNKIDFDFANDGVLTYYNSKNNMYYALNLRTLNAGHSFRTAIVETGSEIDFALAFDRKLIDAFGTTDGITWAYEKDGVISRDASMVLANKPGIGKIVASKGDKKETFYIVVADVMSALTSSTDFEKENFAYTYLVKNSIDIKEALKIEDSSADYIVLDSATDGLSKEGNILKATSVGRKTFVLLDVVNDDLFEYTFEAIYITPFISTFTDIIGANNRVDIEYLCERGVISQYPDLKYKTENKMTTKEFLTMLNRVRLSYDSNFVYDKKDKLINLDKRDFDYYSSLNILANFDSSEAEEILGTYTLNKAITFEEAVKLISTTLLYNENHTETGVDTPDGLSKAEEAAKHLITLEVIKPGDERNGTREITKSEVAYMLAQTIRFLEY